MGVCESTGDSPLSDLKREQSTLSEFEEQYIHRLRILELLTAICSTTFTDVSQTNGFMQILVELWFQLVGPIGLLGNLASLMSICDHWRGIDRLGNTWQGAKQFRSTLPDVWWVYLINGISLALGLLANLVLMVHMELSVEHHRAVLFSSGLYLSCVVLYMGLLGAVEFEYFNHPGVYRTIGYWQVACASVFYALGAIITLVYAVYTRNRKWNSATSRRQRMVMILCTVYFGWIAGGAGIFHIRALSLDVQYSQDVYFVVVSCLTLGYGDIVATNTLGRMLVIPLIYIGIILGGWVAVAVFQGNLNKAHNVVVDVGVETLRQRALQHPELGECLDHTDRSFMQMRRIVQSVLVRDRMVHASMTVAWLVVFLLCGALVFHFTESWAYSDAFYMCAISLVEVGYGDFVPSSPGGRAMFIHYALVALPTTVAAVSDLGAFLELLVKKYARSHAFVWSLSRPLRGELPTPVMQMLNEHPKGSVEWSRILQRHKVRTAHTGTYIDEVQRKIAPDSPWQSVFTMAKWDTAHGFDYSVWRDLMCRLLGVSQLPPGFWLSEFSPIRHASLDEKQFLTMVEMHVLSKEYPL